jgi:hypothetical protein
MLLAITAAGRDLKILKLIGRGGVMFSTSILFKFVLLLVLAVLALGIIPGASVLADGTGGVPDPPVKAPSNNGDIGYDSLINAILTTLELTI